MMSNLDEHDLAILSCLQENARTGLDALAGTCGLSVATVQRRLKRLREDKVIEREIAVLNPESVDQAMTFIVMVELERERLDKLEAFRRTAIAEPEVQQCYYITGEADFCLVCSARNMADFEEFTHRLFFGNDNVRRFRTSVVMSRAKVGLSLPLKQGD